VRELREEIFPYWRGKTLEDCVASRVPEEIQAGSAGKAFSLNQTDHAQGHILPDVARWLRLGVSGLRAEGTGRSSAGQSASRRSNKSSMRRPSWLWDAAQP